MKRSRLIYEIASWTLLILLILSITLWFEDLKRDVALTDNYDFLLILGFILGMMIIIKINDTVNLIERYEKRRKGI